jgi:hypothetical protein
MFTHPALLRELTLTAEHLRRYGETEWSRRVVQTAERLRRVGWTEEGRRVLRELFDGSPSLHGVRFGPEHARHTGGEEGAERANRRLELHRLKLAELGSLPTHGAPLGPRRRSPDLKTEGGSQTVL